MVRNVLIIPEDDHLPPGARGIPGLACIANVDEVNPTFCWTAVETATSYDFELATDIDFLGIIAFQDNIVGLCYTFVGQLDPGTYYWRVRAERNDGNGFIDVGQWSAPCVITITSVVPQPVLVCTGSVDGADVTFSWNSAAGAIAYEFELATDPVFGTLLLHDTTPATSYHVGFLPTGTYFWRVRGIDVIGRVGAWSNTCDVTINNSIGIPAPVCPGEVNQDSPVFCWSAVPTATSYEFEIADDAGFTVILEDILGITSTCHTFGGSLDAGSHYWRVRAYRDNGSGVIDISDWSNTCFVTVTPFFNIIAKTSTTNTVEWGKLPLSTVNVRIERQGSINSDTTVIGTFRTVNTVPKASTPLTDSNLLPGFPYTYRLIAIDGGAGETTPCADVSDITNPDGAYLSTVNGATVDSGLYNAYGLGMPSPSFFAQVFDYNRFTVEFRMVRHTTDPLTVWGLETEENLFYGGIYKRIQIGLSGSGWKLWQTPYFTDISNMPFDGVSAATACVVGEEHHWAFTFDGSEDSPPHYTIKIFKDGTLVETLTSNANPVNFVMVPPVYYPNEVFFRFMVGGIGIATIDEFRVWNYTRSQTEINTFKSYVVRESPELLYRWGFDNFDLITPNSYPPEFTSFGRYSVDPAHTAAYINGGDSRVHGTFEDRSEQIEIAKNIVEPLAVGVPGLPVKPLLITPSDGSVIDLDHVLFTWTSSGYDHFEFQIASDNTFATIVYSDTNVPSQSTTPTGLTLTAGTTYYWRVRAVSGVNFSAYSDFFSFVSNIVITSILTNPVAVLVTEPYDTQLTAILTAPTSTIVTIP